MRYFLSHGEPQATRILLVESGSRHLAEGLIPHLRRSYGESIGIDLVTCYAGLPRGCSPETTRIYRVSDYRGGSGLGRLCRELAANRYSSMGMICSAEPIMTKWKWALALRLPAKVFIVNENGDYFWLDRGHASAIRHFVLFRAGLAGSGAVRTAAGVALFPLTLLYLLLYATVVHSKRALPRG